MRQRRHPLDFPLKPDIWPNLVYPSDMKAWVLERMLNGSWGPFTPKEREAIEFWLSIRRLEAAAE